MPGEEPKIFVACRAPYRDPDGKIIGVIGVSRDMTEQRQLERIADQSQGADRASVAGGVGGGDGFESGARTESAADGDLKLRWGLPGLRKTGRHGEIQRGDGGISVGIVQGGEPCRGDHPPAAGLSVQAIAPAHSPQDIKRPVEEAVELMRHMFQRAGMRPRLDIASDLPEVEVDSVQIQQVLINLIQNALDSMDKLDSEEKRLVIRVAATSSGQVRVSVIDGGAGVSAAISGKIFESYFTTKPQGLGLGLSICRSIVESHGGRLSAAANADRGMTFEFSLPPAGRA